MTRKPKSDTPKPISNKGLDRIRGGQSFKGGVMKANVTTSERNDEYGQ